MRPPIDGNWNDYKPPKLGPDQQQPPGFEPRDSCIDPNDTGMRNQNIYTSLLTQGVIVGSPGNDKPLGNLGNYPDFLGGGLIPRVFVIFVENTTDVPLIDNDAYVQNIKIFRLKILNQPQPDGRASFTEFGDVVDELDVMVPPHSTMSQAVYVASSNPDASVEVQVDEIDPDGNIITTNYVTLNPDPTSPEIDLGDEYRNPNIINPNIINYELTNPNIINPNIINPNIINPNIINPNIINPNIINPNIINPNIINPNIINPNIINPNIINPNIINGSITDLEMTVKNEGNATSSYIFGLLTTSSLPPRIPEEAIQLQLLIYRIHYTPVDKGCGLEMEPHQELAASIPNPNIINPNIINPNIINPNIINASFFLAPEEEARLVLRVIDPGPYIKGGNGSMVQSSGGNFDPEAYLNTVGGFVRAMGTNSAEARQGVTTSPGDSTLLMIGNEPFPDGEVGKLYSVDLTAYGGTGEYTDWSVIAGSLPPNLNIEGPDGYGVYRIYGTPTTAGVYNFTLQVTDSDLKTATQDYSITIFPAGGGYTISGTMTVDGLGLVGVVMNGLPNTPQTDASGYYSDVVVRDWNGIVTPIKSGYTLVPSSIDYIDVSSNQTNQNYTAAIIAYILTINTAGTGSGTVTSDVGGINCGEVCQATYTHGTVVTLTATPDANSVFAGWAEGGCSGTGICEVTMDTSKTVNAAFIAVGPCASGDYTISPTEDYFSSSGGSGSVVVTTETIGCSWTAVSNDGWISITSGSSGIGSGTVNYSVAANSSSTDNRTGTLTIAGKTFSVHQSGTILTPPILTDTLSPGGSLNEPNKMATLPAGEVISKVDVMFLFDLTGSMSSELTTAKAESGNIMSELRKLVPDSEFGVISFMDYPYSYNWSLCSEGGTYSAIYGDASFGDYPYSLDQAVTTDTALVTSAITSLLLGYGADGPESYSRVLYELYSDASVGWREGAKRIAILFCDNIPHDEAYYTGLDPGRDDLKCTPDDLSFVNDIVPGLVANGITVLVLDSGSPDQTPWNLVTSETGGVRYTLSHANAKLIPGVIVTLIEAEIQTIDLLTLRAEAGYEGWISFTPSGGYSDVTPGESGTTRTFNLTITVPAGTASGTYKFRIELVGDENVLAWQIVTITVVL